MIFKDIWDRICEKIAQKKWEDPLVDSMFIVYGILCDSLAIAAIVCGFWFLSYLFGNLMSNEVLKIGSSTITYEDVVKYGDFGTVVVFVIKSLIRFFRSSE